MDRVIRSIAFHPDGVEVVYIDMPGGVRENGLTQQHMLIVPVDQDYVDEVEAVVEAATALLEDALEDFDRVPAYVPDDRDDGDDDDDDD